MDYRDKLGNLLEETVKKNASDLHITVGFKPIIRVDGFLNPIASEKELTPADAEGLVLALLNEKQKQQFLQEKEIDLGFDHKGQARFRVNVYFEKGYMSAALRLIPAKIKTIDELEMPPILHNFTGLSQGFVLVVGPAGHGKSATIAALIDEINHNRKEHIITIEDPIEYLVPPDQSMISQREVNIDTLDFHRALKSVLRQDPDVIMIGEMRDQESISTALTAAETGHLVFSTLHTNSAAQTIDRIIDTFPPEKQLQVSTQLAATLVGIVSKRLLPKIGGGRIPACEVLLVNSAVRNLIRERKTHQLDLVVETNLKNGMLSLNRSLALLVKQKKITLEDAQLYSLSSNELSLMLEKI